MLIQTEPPPPPQRPLSVHFAQPIDLIGLDVDPQADSYAPGDEVHVRLHWQATGPISADYTVFTHLVGQDGNPVFQLDNMPQQNRYLTSLWSPGEVILDDYGVLLPPDLPAGTYQLRVGLYQLETGQRVPLRDGTADYAQVVSLEVKSP